jgi:putative membrane protein
MSWLPWLSWFLVALVAVLHVVFMVAEMLFWSKLATRVAGLSPAVADATKALGKNQGLYNGFLAAGLIWSLGWPPPMIIDVEVAGFFLICVLVAGVFGAFTIKPLNRGLLIFQAAPALAALIALGCVEFLSK